MVRRWHADPFGFLRPWNEVPALMGSAPPATPPSTGTGVVTFLMGSVESLVLIRALALQGRCPAPQGRVNELIDALLKTSA